MGFNGMRWVMCVTCFIATCFAYYNRQNINIAIVDMIQMKDVVPDESPLNLQGTLSPNGTKSSFSYRKKWYETASVDTVSPVFLELNQTLPKKSNVKRYDWSEVEKGLVLGSFYMSYIVFQVPLAVLSEKMGGKWILFVSLFFSTVVSMMTPFITDHVYALVASRVALGAFQSGTFPASYDIMVKWMPASDRPFAYCLMDGSGFGSFAAYLSSGFIIEDYGWPMIFYVSAFLAFTATILTLFLLRSSPDGCSFISGTEREFIRKGQRQVPSDAEILQVKSKESTSDKKELLNESEKQVPIPWMKILSSKSIISMMYFRFTYGWCFYMVVTETPSYLNQVVHESMRNNGAIVAMTQLSSLCSMMTMGYISERLIERGIFERTMGRKFFTMLTGIGTGVCLLLIPFTTNHTILVSLLMAGSFMQGFRSGGDMPMPSEMSIRFPTTLYALFNIVGASTGMVVPYFVGFVLNLDPGSAGWNLLFWLAGAISISGVIVFSLFASSKRQDFDYVDGEARDGANSAIQLG